MKGKANIQWAPGTRLSRMDKEDGQHEFEMDLIKKRVERRELEQISRQNEAEFKRALIQFNEGDLIFAYGEFEVAGEIDPMGDWVMIRGYKHGIEGCKPLPQWFKDAYEKMKKEIDGEKNGD